jgi:hypothetical protein
MSQVPQLDRWMYHVLQVKPFCQNRSERKSHSVRTVLTLVSIWQNSLFCQNVPAPFSYVPPWMMGVTTRCERLFPTVRFCQNLLTEQAVLSQSVQSSVGYYVFLRAKYFWCFSFLVFYFGCCPVEHPGLVYFWSRLQVLPWTYSGTGSTVRKLFITE